MGLPKKLIKFNVFNEGENYIGQVAEVTLPKLGWKTEEYSGGGMVGSIDIPLLLEKMEAELSFGGLMRQPLQQFGICGVDKTMLRFAGAYQAADACEVSAVEVVMRGFHREIDFGNAKQGDDTEFKVMSSLAYYKLTIDGDDVIEIDALNTIFKVNGEDRYAEHRKAIGI